jgi:hypothetical protein|tara:strand:- start:234 stop:638 length:405 start_codon:yes stop_codon:yes gene_type:complete
MATRQTDSKKEKHNKHYHNKGRNGWTPSNTWQDEVIEDKDNKWDKGKINPKMLLTKEELNMKKIDYENHKTPNYYIGEVFRYEARNIIEDFDLSYNLGTCISYILRAKRKHDTQIDCIQKAINHLEFELDKLKR